MFKTILILMACASTYFGAYILGKSTQFEVFFNPESLMFMGGVIYTDMVIIINKML